MAQAESQLQSPLQRIPRTALTLFIQVRKKLANCIAERIAKRRRDTHTWPLRWGGRDAVRRLVVVVVVVAAIHFS